MDLFKLICLSQISARSFIICPKFNFPLTTCQRFFILNWFWDKFPYFTANKEILSLRKYAVLSVLILKGDYFSGVKLFSVNWKISQMSSGEMGFFCLVNLLGQGEQFLRLFWGVCWLCFHNCTMKHPNQKAV